MIALLVAFSLQLDDPAWAGTSALIVAQPVLGATLRKGVLRLSGTAVGACAGVALFACFPQDRWGFVLGLAAWCGACSVAATLLGDLLAYAPLLAGYTCAIVAMAAISNPPDVFLLAVARGACIAIGIVSTTLVFSLTGRGRQRGRLAELIGTTADEAMRGLLEALQASAPAQAAGQSARRALVARLATLDGVLDQATGENFDLRTRAGVLRRAIAGLMVILSSWRGVEQHRRRTSETRGVLLARDRLSAAIADASAAPASLRETAGQIEREAVQDPSERLLLDRVAHAVAGLADVRAGLILLLAPLDAASEPGLAPTRLRNPYDAVLNGIRSLLVVLLACGIWIVTGWEAGTQFVIFAAVVVLLFGIRGEAAYTGSVTMAASCGLAIVMAAVVKFAAMPWAQGHGFDGFGSFCVLLGVPVALFGVLGAALTQGGTLSVVALTTMAIQVAVLSPTNEITFDFAGFLDGGLAILGGVTLAAAAHRLIPPLPRRLRVALLLRATRRDLRRLASRRWRPSIEEWEARQYARSTGMPPGAAPLDLGRLLAALAVGRELLYRQEMSPTDDVRRRASESEVAEAVASHPQFFDELGLPSAAR